MGTCPICKYEYANLLAHILTYQDNSEYQQLLSEQCEIAKKLYVDPKYTCKTHTQYNLLLTQEEYGTIWYTILKYPKRNIRAKPKEIIQTCPYCNKQIKIQTYNRHLCAEHLAKYTEQVQIAKELFYDYNFTRATIDQYPNVHLNATTIYNIWKQTYTKEERNMRARKCNGCRVSQVIKGKTYSPARKERLSKAQINYRKNHIIASPNQFAVQGYRPDIGHYAHSTYEANIYRIFQYENKAYKKETENVFKIIFPDKTVHNYIVDICDTEGLFASPGTYIEIKGYMDKKSLMRIECFKKQYPQYNLIVIGKCDKNSYPYDIDYTVLEKQYQPLLPFWETKQDNIRNNPVKWHL